MKEKPEQEQMAFSLFVVMIQMIQMIPAKVKAIREKKKYQAK
jgi:hypothetical protein